MLWHHLYSVSHQTMNFSKVFFIFLFPIIVFSSFAQSSTNSKFFIEGFIKGCKEHKDAALIRSQFGSQKTEIALDVYCKCRAEFMSTNLTFKQLENIYYKKEQMDLNLFSKMETKCVKEIAHLLQ